MSDVRKDPKRTALLVVDVQNDFCHPDGALQGGRLDNMESMADRNEALIQAARKAGVPVIFVVTEHTRWTNAPSWMERRRNAKGALAGSCLPGTWGAGLYRLQATDEDRILTKHRYSAFIATDLDMILRTLGVEHIVVTGVNTNICVDSTARHGYMLDYFVSVPSDCCTTGGPPEYHDYALKLLEGLFAQITTSADHIAVWESAVVKG